MDPRNDKEYELGAAEKLSVDSRQTVRRVLILVGTGEQKKALQGAVDRLAAFPGLARVRVVWTGFAQCVFEPALLDLQQLAGLERVEIVGMPLVPRTPQGCRKIAIRKTTFDHKAPVCWNCAVACKTVFEKVEGLLFDGEGLCPTSTEVQVRRCSVAFGRRGWAKCVQTVCVSDSSVVDEIYAPGTAVRSLCFRGVRSARSFYGPLGLDWTVTEINACCSALTHLVLDSEGAREKLASLTRFPPRLVSFCGDFFSMDVPVIPAALQTFRAKIHMFAMAGTFVWPQTIRVVSLSFGDYNADHTAEQLERAGRLNDLFGNMPSGCDIEQLRVVGLTLPRTKEAVRQGTLYPTTLSFG